MTKFRLERGLEVELWVDVRLSPRPAQFPYVGIEREFEEKSVKRVRAKVFAAPHVSPRLELVRSLRQLPSSDSGFDPHPPYGESACAFCSQAGSIDADLALDADKLNGGRYAELLKQLLDTRCYVPGAKDFQLVAEVDPGDGGVRIQVEVEFLAPHDVKMAKNRLKLLVGAGFSKPTVVARRSMLQWRWSCRA